MAYPAQNDRAYPHIRWKERGYPGVATHYQPAVSRTPRRRKSPQTDRPAVPQGLLQQSPRWNRQQAGADDAGDR